MPEHYLKVSPQLNEPLYLACPKPISGRPVRTGMRGGPCYLQVAGPSTRLAVRFRM